MCALSEKESVRICVCVCLCAWAPVNVNLTSNLPWLPSLPNCFNPLKQAQAEKGRDREGAEVQPRVELEQQQLL